MTPTGEKSVEALDGEFDFVGLPVRVGGDEGVGDALHLRASASAWALIWSIRVSAFLSV